MERPAFGTVVSRGLRPIERPFALQSIEAAHVPAAERHPDHTLTVDVATAHAETGQRHTIDLGQCGIWRIRSRHKPDDRASNTLCRSPYRSVSRMRHHRIERRVNAGI